MISIYGFIWDNTYLYGIIRVARTEATLSQVFPGTVPVKTRVLRQGQQEKRMLFAKLTNDVVLTSWILICASGGRKYCERGEVKHSLDLERRDLLDRTKKNPTTSGYQTNKRPRLPDAG